MAKLVKMPTCACLNISACLVQNIQTIKLFNQVHNAYIFIYKHIFIYAYICIYTQCIYLLIYDIICDILSRV